MSVQELETAVARLTAEELSAFSQWFEEYLADRGTPDEEISPEWREEIHRRATEIDKGKVTLVDGEDFLKRLRAI